MEISTILVLIFAVALSADGLEREKRGVLGEMAENSRYSTNITQAHHFQMSHEQVARIGSFNMKQFGAKKASNGEILRILSKIVRRYDLIALQEITDVKGAALKTLMEAINYDSEYPYHFVVSPRVGRTNQKEQYALIYRPEIFQVKNHLLFDDSIGDPFSREPHIADIIMKPNNVRFGLINVHVVPRDAPAEIDTLTDVVAWVEARLRMRNVVILGDLNADCDYIRKKDLPNIRLMNSPKKFNWLIPDNFDTTVGNTDCAYDRIIVTGPYFTKAYEPGSAGVFQFDSAYALDKKVALNVSDHYPVEFIVRVHDKGDGPGTRPVQSVKLSSSAGKSAQTLSYVGLAVVMVDVLYLLATL